MDFTQQISIQRTKNTVVVIEIKRLHRRNSGDRATPSCYNHEVALLKTLSRDTTAPALHHSSVTKVQRKRCRL